MREEISAISPAEPVTRQERKQPTSERRATAASPPPEPPATHPHKGRLLDVMA